MATPITSLRKLSQVEKLMSLNKYLKAIIIIINLTFEVKVKKISIGKLIPDPTVSWPKNRSYTCFQVVVTAANVTWRSTKIAVISAITLPLFHYILSWSPWQKLWPYVATKWFCWPKYKRRWDVLVPKSKRLGFSREQIKWKSGEVLFKLQFISR